MKIVFLCRLFWPHGGGVETHVEELSLQLIKSGHKVTIITEQYDPELPLAEFYQGIEIVRIPYFALKDKRMLWTFIANQSKLLESADIIHAHDVFWWILVEKIFNPMKRMFVTFHGYEGVGLPRFRAKVHRKLVEILSSGSICIGDFMKKWYWANPTIVSYGAADCNTLADGKKTNTAVFWGRLDYDTGINVYVDIASKLQIPLDIYGDGPLKKKINNVGLKIHNWEKNKSKFIGKHRFAFVSRYLSIIEAMQAKQLVVAVYNNEIKKDYLLMHPIANAMIIGGSSKEVVDKIRTLTPQKEAEMIDLGYNLASELTFERMKDQYLRLWQMK